MTERSQSETPNHMDFQLQQDNLTLRIFDPSEAPILFQLINDNRNHLIKWFPWAKTMKTIKDIASFLKDQRIEFNLGRGIYLGIWYENVLVGIISLKKIDLVNQKAELGYWLSGANEGKGIMYKSCQLLLNHAFNILQLHRIDVTHIQENIRSQKLINKLGFIHEGTQRQSGLLNGKYVDHETYGLLNSEWKD